MLLLLIGLMGQGGDPSARGPWTKISWAGREVVVRRHVAKKAGPLLVLLLGRNDTLEATWTAGVRRVDEFGGSVAMPELPGTWSPADYEFGGIFATQMSATFLEACIRSAAADEVKRPIIVMANGAGAQFAMVAAAFAPYPCRGAILVNPPVPLSPRIDLAFPKGLGKLWDRAQVEAYVTAPLVLVASSDEVPDERDPKRERVSGAGEIADAVRQSFRTAMRRERKPTWEYLSLPGAPPSMAELLFRPELRRLMQP